MGLKHVGLALAVVFLTYHSARAGEGKISGEFFGDVYWLAAHHDSALEDRNGTWFRRLNLTYDYKFDESVSSRVRFEAASPGDFTSKESLDVFMKDIWIKWKKSGHALIVGLSPTPTWSVVEDVWGYRPLEKVPADMQRFASSRDMGIAVTGTFGESRKLGYHVMGGNGASLDSETDAKKKGMAALRFWPVEELVFEVYGDYEDREGSGERTTFHVFAGYDAAKLRAGLQWIGHERKRVGEDLTIDVVSGFVTGSVSERVWLIGRVDRIMDPNPDGKGVAYLSFDPTAASTFILAGVDYRVTDGVSFIPNAEVVVYDAPDAGGPTPDTDAMLRFTFAARF